MRIPNSPLGLMIAVLFYNRDKEDHQRLDIREFWMVPSHIQHIVGNHLHNLRKLPQNTNLAS